MHLSARKYSQNDPATAPNELPRSWAAVKRSRIRRAGGTTGGGGPPFHPSDHGFHFQNRTRCPQLVETKNWAGAHGAVKLAAARWSPAAPSSPVGTPVLQLRVAAGRPGTSPGVGPEGRTDTDRRLVPSETPWAEVPGDDALRRPSRARPRDPGARHRGCSAAGGRTPREDAQGPPAPAAEGPPREEGAKPSLPLQRWRETRREALKLPEPLHPAGRHPRAGLPAAESRGRGPAVLHTRESVGLRPVSGRH